MEKRVVFKIWSTFNLKGLGRVYEVKGETYPSRVYLHDILYDCQGCRFQVISFELISVKQESNEPQDMPIFLKLKSLDGKDVQGDTLTMFDSIINSKTLLPRI